jgi:hypothetical protein
MQIQLLLVKLALIQIQLIKQALKKCIILFENSFNFIVTLKTAKCRFSRQYYMLLSLSVYGRCKMSRGILIFCFFFLFTDRTDKSSCSVVLLIDRLIVFANLGQY